MMTEPSDTERISLLGSLNSEDTEDQLPYKNNEITKKKTTLAECILTLLINGIPTILSTAAGYIMLTMNIHFLSKSGQLSWIGGAGLSQTWINTVFTYLVSSLNMGTVVLSSPAYGAQNYHLVGINFHRSCILRLLYIIPSYTLVLLSYQIFTAVGTQQDLAQQVYLYGVYSLPAMFFLTLLNTMSMFIITHQAYLPVLVVQILEVFIHWGTCEFYIIYLQLGVRGAALAYGTSLFVGVLLLFIYVLLSDKFKQTLFWFEKESFQGLFIQLKNEFFIGAPYYLEWLAFELFMLLSMTFGLLQLTGWIIIYHMAALIYMVPLGFGIVISQQIATSIGEKDLHKTKTLVRASIYFSIVVGILDAIIVYLLRKPFIQTYNDSNEKIYNITLSLLKIYLLMMPADFLQTAVMAILKAIGKEKRATLIFLIAYYAVGMSLAYILGVWEGFKSKGVVIGLTSGCYLLLTLSSITLYYTDITAQAKEIFERRTK